MTDGRTIVAVSTPSGAGGIAIVRMSGPDALRILSRVWRGKNPSDFSSHTAHLGWILDEDNREIDQVMVLWFRSPRSYTGEDVVEISCHGSPWIQQAIVTRLIENGASSAGAGEFTRRAFMNGRLDLAQAEGVADLIASSSRASALLAATQLKGEYSRELDNLRERLLNLGVLLELELDFSEEDVEFADRQQLISTATEIKETIDKLTASFKSGSAFKNGVPVVIAGSPNAGKSTLLNALVGEEKAIVSDIPGTTRDAIEDTVEIGGVLFRFVDTAGLRDSNDEIEKIGIERARKKIAESAILLYLIDPTGNIEEQRDLLNDVKKGAPDKVIEIFTKEDILKVESPTADLTISAITGSGIGRLKDLLHARATSEFDPGKELIVTNARHYEALIKAASPIERLIDGLQSGLSADFLAQDLHEAVSYLGEITGAVSSEDILHSIFERYCIGK